jgi:signal transduction histidine kinase
MLLRIAIPAAVLLFWLPPAVADCFADLLATDGSLGELVKKDPSQAILLLKAELQKGGAVEMTTRAHLYAMLMDALVETGDVQAARQAAVAGMDALSSSDDDALARRLRLRSISLLELQGQLVRAADQYEIASAETPLDAPDLACVLIKRGYLRFRTGRVGGATSDLLAAYAAARDRRNDEYRLHAGYVLSMLYSRYGFYDDAHALVEEAVQYYSKSKDRALLSEAYYRRGDVSLYEGLYEDAQNDFRRALEIGRRASNPLQIAVQEQRLCKALSLLPNRADSVAVCKAAYSKAISVNDSETAKVVLASLAQISLDGGHPKAAIDLLNRALAKDGVDLSESTSSKLHGLRARARERIGDYRRALQDTGIYLEYLLRERAANDTNRIAVQRAQLDNTVKDVQLSGARAEARIAALAASRQVLLRHVAVSCSLAATIIILVAAWQWRKRHQLEGARHGAAVRLAFIARLTGGVAHEFNNRLTVIRQAVELLRREPGVCCNSSTGELIDEIDESSRACADMTTQLLSFSRQQHLMPHAIVMESFLAQVRPTLGKVAGLRVTLETSVCRPVPIAWADERLLTAALINLTSNARDAMENGGKLCIRVTSEDVQRVRIEVADEGCGIAADVISQVTEPFYTTKAAGLGSGLGLSMVEGFVTQSGGTMTLTSELNRGTTVALLLPAGSMAL